MWMFERMDWIEWMLIAVGVIGTIATIAGSIGLYKLRQQKKALDRVMVTTGFAGCMGRKK